MPEASRPPVLEPSSLVIAPYPEVVALDAGADSKIHSFTQTLSSLGFYF